MLRATQQTYLRACHMSGITMVHASKAVQFSNMRYNTKHLPFFWSDYSATRQRALHYGGARRVLARPPRHQAREGQSASCTPTACSTSAAAGAATARLPSRRTLDPHPTLTVFRFHFQLYPESARAVPAPPPCGSKIDISSDGRQLHMQRLDWVD